MGELIKCVSMDPPWLERGGGKIKRGADRHYPLMDVKNICGLLMSKIDWHPSPMFPLVGHAIAPDAHCWIWITDNFLQDGLWLMEQLGFRYIRTLQWVKMRGGFTELLASATGYDAQYIARANLQIGLGQYLRGAHEMCLFGTRGNAQVPDPADRLPSVVFAERTKHSAKPQEAYNVIERVSPGPRLEIFARDERPGWDVWGNEV